MKRIPALLLTLPLFASAAAREADKPHSPGRKKVVRQTQPDMDKVRAAVARLLAPLPETRHASHQDGYFFIVRSARRVPTDAGRRRYMTGGLGDHAQTGYGMEEFYHHD